MFLRDGRYYVFLFLYHRHFYFMRASTAVLVLLQALSRIIGARQLITAGHVLGDRALRPERSSQSPCVACACLVPYVETCFWSAAAVSCFGLIIIAVVSRFVFFPVFRLAHTAGFENGSVVDWFSRRSCSCTQFFAGYSCTYGAPSPLLLAVLLVLFGRCLWPCYRR